MSISSKLTAKVFASITAAPGKWPPRADHHIVVSRKLRSGYALPAFPAPAAPSRIPTPSDHLTPTAAVAVFCSALWSGFSPPLTAGAGVAPERLPHLFRKYAGDGEGGVGRGLGLAICKGLVEAHGGRIRAESEGQGRGTRVAFTVPMIKEAGDARAEDTRSRSGSGSDALREAPVLVVDDDPQTLRYVRDTLADAGYSALVTGDPQGLSRIVREEDPQLVLLDLMLPGTDGIELMQRTPELADVPVMFISGYGRDETIARAL